MTDRTVAALASALPAGISYDTGAMGFTGKRHPAWDAARIARFQANILAESGWRLVHDGDPPQAPPEPDPQAVDPAWLDGLSLVRVRIQETPLVVSDPDQIHDHVEVSDE